MTLTDADLARLGALDKASNLLYEVAAWLHDVGFGEADFEEMDEALESRLVPTADAAVHAVRDVLGTQAAELREARAALARVKALHAPMGHEDWATSCGECGLDYPCPTHRAIGGASGE